MPEPGPAIPASFNPGSLYIAGFTQARAPHVGLILPVDAQSGDLVHIRIDRSISPNWMYQHRAQKIEGDMFLSSLLKIHDVPAGAITVEDLQKAASVVPAPQNDTFGECSRWLYMVIQELDRLKLVVLKDVVALEEEFSTFASDNRAYARRDRFPNVAVSPHCA
ncbi:hypothetical protein GSI_00274 [Ganoderma sinense ZZ0214-1]|uniref:Uncharacterized protein n=1 Tax=Ganoderma sinense ZZ0214-1 TaxID=1077348 RepID=A0A2G8SS38_9APHY|nr:hypothetical protein GSI_00274 [Ganoderma sinense ZZ0214-1]